MSAVVDWSTPIIGEPTEKGGERGVKPIHVAIDKTFHRRPNHVPVKVPANLWTGGLPAGTWYFTDDGESVGGKNEQGGQDALWRVRNGSLV